MSAPTVLTAKTPPPTQAPSSFTSDRHANPVLSGVPARKENFTWAAVLAIVSTILFLALLFMQWSELSFMQNMKVFNNPGLF